jgi:D-cysteine desulfhydrase
MRRLSLVHAPTPIVRRQALDLRLGVELWIKRDDVTGGAESGNKLRKLELLMADAVAKKATVVLTCGGIQSNHARATAIVCAQLGIKCMLFLRVRTGPTSVDRPAVKDALPRTGNVLLDRLVGAEIRLITPEDYAQRAAVMESVALDLARAGERPYVIPEGGSNALGSLGYVEAMGEVRGQIDLGLAGARTPFDVIVHACGSGGTAAGTALGAARYGTAASVRAICVCDDTAYFERVTTAIMHEARAMDPELPAPVPLVLDDRAKGPGYGVMDDAQKRFVVEVARTSGLLLDPVYTGKALYGLERAIARGEVPRGARVLFLHTGGLPGLLAQGDDLADAL